MYKLGFLFLLGLTATAATARAQDNPILQPTIVQVESKVQEPPAPVEPTDLDRQLLKLKAQREALAADQDTAKQQFADGMSLDSSETDKLRAHLGQLISKLGAAPQGKNVKEPLSPVPPQPLAPMDLGKKVDSMQPKQTLETPHAKIAPKETTETAPPADALALGHVLFKAGNWELALKAYKMVPTSGMKADERAPIQFLMASCLRKMGKLEDASAMYRDVANIRGDEQVAACAQWQLVQLRWQSEFEAQLKDVRKRREALETSK